MDIKPITVEYIDHLGSDLTVVNAALQLAISNAATPAEPMREEDKAAK